ncbi:MAG: AAA domain-containing protein [Candidatus Altiarchaeales archaeon]|nr:AAA domain-containing protein [Candidatus Altiarchaeales archaeon]MBD3415612.1 AAA domain-containing protein [Candidatus Altiarchaeales archaeon]
MCDLKKIESFIGKHKEQLRKLGEKYPERKSLILDFEELERYDNDLADRLRATPDEVLVDFNDVLNAMGVLTMVENPKFNVRFKNMPRERGYTILVRDITAEHIGKYLQVEGVVNRISDVLPKVSKALFVCNRCDEHNWIQQDKRMLIEPSRCRSCGKGDFRFIPEESEWIDVQHIEIQEPLEMLKGGEQARRIELWAEEDMTDEVTAGDKILVTGTVRLKPPKFKGSVYQKFIEVNHLEGIEREFEEFDITDEEEKEILELSKDPRLHDKIVGSIAPSIYGYNEVKEAIALQLFGGRQGKILPDGTKARGDMHLLLIGDPGVAKSRILQYVDQIAPKSIYVTGKGTTGAGLTATAERDELADGAWTLKAGALVLAGGGIAGIDEFDKMSKEDRSAMHEAMEQQTISVAKAGIITKFKANTSILAASNPKFSRFDNYKPLAEQFDIPPTLISRFDLIFPIRDILDSEHDRSIADHMLKMHRSEELEEIKPDIDPELFRKYIAYARRNIHPELTLDTSDKIKEYYVQLRARGKEGTAAATPRQLEALVRLSEASAKLRLSNEVSVGDVERAIKLTDFVIKEIAYDAATGEFDIDRIVTDHPKSVRDRLRTIEDIIRELTESSPDGMASMASILESTGEKDIDKFEVEKLISELKKKGEIYEPRHGKFMFTEE